MKQSLARTRTLLGDLLVRRGADAGESDVALQPGARGPTALADAEKDPAATTDDRLRLGQTLKSQADLLRLNGEFAQAKPVFDQAIAELEAGARRRRRPRRDPQRAGTGRRRSRLGQSRDGDFAAAENDFRRAFELLEKLVAEFPTVPRHREVLAKVCNSLGMLEKDTGRLDEAEIHLRRQVPLARRLAEDFPDRPEYRTILGQGPDPTSASPCSSRAEARNPSRSSARPSS